MGLAVAGSRYHQKADTSRAVALAKQGIVSQQSQEEQVTSLDAAQAAVESARENVSAAQAMLKVATANTIQAQAAASFSGPRF